MKTSGFRFIAAMAITLSSMATMGALRAADAPGPTPAPGSAPSTAPAEASIPFARRNIFNWEADGDKGMWVQAIGRQWYYASFLSPCFDLQFRERVGFRFGPSGELDKWGAVIVPHYPECVFKSFTLSAGPPSAQKKKQAPAASPQTPLASAGRLPITTVAFCGAGTSM